MIGKALCWEAEERSPISPSLPISDPREAHHYIWAEIIYKIPYLDEGVEQDQIIS